MKYRHAVFLALFCLLTPTLGNVLRLKRVPSAHHAVRRVIRANPHFVQHKSVPMHIIKKAVGHRHLHDGEEAGDFEQVASEDEVNDEVQNEGEGEPEEFEEVAEPEEGEEVEEEPEEFEVEHDGEEADEMLDDEGRTPEEEKIISLEDEEVQGQLTEIKENLDEFKALIIEAIDEEYADNMLVEVEDVMVATVGPNYEIVDHLYEKKIKQVQKIFLKIWEAKLKPLRDRYGNEINFLEDTIDSFILKNYKLSPSMDVVKEKAKYFVNELMFDKIVETAREEIDAYDEINEYLKNLKLEIQNYIDQKEREKEGQMASLEENADAIEHEEHHEPSEVHEEPHYESPPHEEEEHHEESYYPSEEGSEEYSESPSGEWSDSEESSEGSSGSEDDSEGDDSEEDGDEDEDEDEDEEGEEEEGEGDEEGGDEGEEGGEGEGGEEGAEGGEEGAEGGERRI